MLLMLLIRLLINAAALYVADWALDGIHHDSTTSLFVMAFIFGLVNAFIRPVVKVLSLPLLILTLWLFTFVINALMLMLSGWIARQFGFGFYVDTFGAALIGSVLISIVSIVLSLLLPARRADWERDER